MVIFSIITVGMKIVRIGFFIILCLSINKLYSNSSNSLDSFVAGVNRATLEDSVDYLLHLSAVNMEKYPDHAFSSASLANEICSQIKLKERKGLSLKYMGEAKLQLEDYYQAKKYLTDALGFLTEEMPRLTGDVHYLLAKTNYFLAEYEESNKYYRSAIQYFEKTNNPQKIANAYQNIGLLFHELDNLEKATYYYNKSLAINQGLDNDTNIAGLYQNLGIIYYHNQDFVQAMHYYEKSINLFRALSDSQNIGTTYSNIGLIRLQQKSYEEAYRNFERSYKLFEYSNYRLGKMWAMHNMGSAKLSALQFTDARVCFDSSLYDAEKLSCPEGVMSNLDALTSLMEQTGQFKEAYYYHLSYTQLKDSIDSYESRERIAELETLYNLQAQEEELNRSLETIKKHKAQKVFFFIILLLISSISFIIYLAYRKKKNEEVEITSDKRNLENVLVEKNKELETQITERQIAVESDKLKSAFLANMSHELRTPMNAIIAFSNFLREPDLPEPKREEYLNHITSAGDSLLRLIDDVIDIAKLESKQLKISIGPVNVSRMLRELKKVFLKLKAKNNYTANLVLSIDKYHDYIINTDVLRIKQILNNLIDNAFKYTNRGVVEFGVSMKDESMLFFVRDTGIGIPPEKQDKVFDRFLQIDSELNRKYGGTGLGLAISKNLAELLGGKIWVESEPGAGSTFYMQIPANDFRMVEVTLDPATSGRLISENNYNWASKTILVAEDEDLNFKVLDSFLSKTKARILRVTDGESAVKMCSVEKVDLVLMDIQMPLMDGYEATRKIKSLHHNLPVIAQTSFAMANEKDRCIDVGCDDYITKPLDLERLLSIIDRYMV
jgi:signal transduction histidine kinase/CheY-like chemotaxis protein